MSFTFYSDIAQSFAIYFLIAAFLEMLYKLSYSLTICLYVQSCHNLSLFWKVVLFRLVPP